MEIAEVNVGKAEICREVLDDLPEWFGIPESKAAYIADSETLPMLVGRADGAVTGFISLKVHTAVAAELYVLGVKRKQHRQGIGRELVAACSLYAIRRNISFLTVKTIAPANSDRNYAATRAFYEAVGFKPLEVFPTLWSAQNPCLLMVKPL